MISIINFSIIPVINQSTQLDDATKGIYRVNVGDSMKYSYVKISDNNRTYIPITIQFDGKLLNINLTQGSIETITIKAKNLTLGNDRIWIQREYSIPGQPKFLDEVYRGGLPFIKKSFTNIEEVDSFINSQNGSQNFTLSVDGDYIKYFYNSSSADSLFHNYISFNWHTGWLEYYEIENYSKYTNKNIIVERITEIIPIIIQYTTKEIIVGVLGIGLVSIAILWINYKNQSKRLLIGDKNNSFIKYLIDKSQKKTKTQSISQIEKNLNLIEEIIEEGKDKIN